MSEQHGRKIFVVDDEHLIAFTLATILKNSGFDAAAFTDPSVAMESAGLLKPALLITDGIMQGMSGIELGKHFSQRLPKCSVLLLSGADSMATLLQTARAQGCEFKLLQKPIHPKELLAEVASLTAR